MKHFLNTQDWSRPELDALLDQAAAFKRSKAGTELKGRSIALVFFNPSLRTRTSFELGAFQLGGHAVVLQPGKDAWPIEFSVGSVMDGDTEEHIAEVAKVLSRYVDLIAVRAFPKFVDWAVDREDIVLRSFARYATVPVINLETITHPCQELAHVLALQEHFGSADLRGKKYVLTWTWHPKSLPVATPHSQLLAAADLGMRVTLLRPEGFGLEPEVVRAARARSESQGGSLEETDDIARALKGAHVVCAKEWGALGLYGRADEERRLKEPLRERWIVDAPKLQQTDDAFFLHCLPVRRNVVVSDAVLNSSRSAVVQQAENRLWTAAAVFGALAPHE